MSEKTTPKKEPLKILYETQFHGKGLAIGVDHYNWTIVHYTKGKDPLESRKRWYFSSLPKMLMALHVYFIKEHIKRLDFKDMAEAVDQSFKQVEILGQELVKIIVAEAPYGALPRFPCDCEVFHTSSKKQPKKNRVIPGPMTAPIDVGQG